MEITILQPLTIRMPNGPQAFEPGQTINLPDNVAQKLMELAPGKVRPVFEFGQLHPNIWIEIDSKIWGLCTAKIKEVTIDGCIITNHSVLKGEGEPVTIPASWICGVYREQQTSS